LYGNLHDDKEPSLRGVPVGGAVTMHRPGCSWQQPPSNGMHCTPSWLHRWHCVCHHSPCEVWKTLKSVLLQAEHSMLRMTCHYGPDCSKG